MTTLIDRYHKVMGSKRTFYVLLAGVIVLVVAAIAGCSSAGNSNTKEHDAANSGIDLILANNPVPIFPSSAMRLEMVEVEAIQALGTPTTTFFFPEGTSIVNVGGKEHYSAPPFKTCPSEGEPIPNTASLTNPLQIQGGTNTQGVVAQMDPNGTYPPTSSSGTYVLCDTASGGQKLAYWEGPVFAESGAAVWNASTGTLDDIGPSKLPVCSLKTAVAGDGSGIKAGTSYYHCVKAA